MRTDVHRPSVINPDDYEFVACEYLRVDDLGTAQFLMEERAKIRAHMARTGGTYSGHEHGGNCHVCGSVNAVYTVLFYHEKTNSYVRTGTECADKLGYGDAERFRKRCANALEAAAGKRKARAVLEARGLAEAWAIYEKRDEHNTDPDARNEHTAGDIVGKLVQYGSLSDKQIAFLATLLDRIRRAPEIAAQRAAEAAAAADFPKIDGRTTVEGVVLSVKWSEFANAPRMLVRADAGWKCWGAVPAIIEDIKVGERVRFDASLKPSDKDPKFGFFKRPTKASKVPFEQKEAA